MTTKTKHNLKRKARGENYEISRDQHSIRKRVATRPLPAPLGAFDLVLFRQEMARVDSELALIRMELSILQEGHGVSAAPQPPPEKTNGLPPGHPLKLFEEQCLTVSGSWAEANCGAVSRRYQTWSAAQEGHTKMNHIKFARAISAVFPRRGCPNRVVYTGVYLKPPILQTPATHARKAPNAVTNSDEEDIALGQHIGSDSAGKQLDCSPI
jgi:hypothetical protein